MLKGPVKILYDHVRVPLPKKCALGSVAAAFQAVDKYSDYVHGRCCNIDIKTTLFRKAAKSLLVNCGVN
jgi:hypothetical protein